MRDEFSDGFPGQYWTKNKISSKIKCVVGFSQLRGAVSYEYYWWNYENSIKKSINDLEFTGIPSQWEQIHLTQLTVDQMLKVSFMLCAVRTDFCPLLCNSFSPYMSVGFLSMRAFLFLHSGLIKISVKKHHSLLEPLKWIISGHQLTHHVSDEQQCRKQDWNPRNCWLFLVGKMY